VPAARRNISLACAVLAVAALCAAAAGCGSRGGSSEDPQAGQQTTLRQARIQASRAAMALVDRDREGFLLGFSSDDGSPASAEALRGLGEVFDTLSRLPWRTFSLEVTPLDQDGVYRVRGTGQLGDAGPRDRIAVVRYLRLRDVARGVVVLADETPEDLRSRYAMGLHDPLVLQRPGLIVLGDRRAHRHASHRRRHRLRLRRRRA
jgi:hypothetical protein